MPSRPAASSAPSRRQEGPAPSPEKVAQYDEAARQVVNQTLNPLLRRYQQKLFAQIEGEDAKAAMQHQLKDIWDLSFMSRFDAEVALADQGDLGRVSQGLAASLRSIIAPRYGSMSQQDRAEIEDVLDQIAGSMRTR